MSRHIIEEERVEQERSRAPARKRGRYICHEVDQLYGKINEADSYLLQIVIGLTRNEERTCTASNKWLGEHWKKRSHDSVTRTINKFISLRLIAVEMVELEPGKTGRWITIRKDGPLAALAEMGKATPYAKVRRPPYAKVRRNYSSTKSSGGRTLRSAAGNTIQPITTGPLPKGTKLEGPIPKGTLDTLEEEDQFNDRVFHDRILREEKLKLARSRIRSEAQSQKVSRRPPRRDEYGDPA